jgi:hypothetical protein
MPLRSGGLRALAALLLGTALVAPCLLWHEPADQRAGAEEIADLKDQLKNGLQARRPEDRAFLDRVAKMVESDQLPVELVKSTFQWARTRKKPYPYPYFEKALKLRAAELGITVQ